MMIPYPVVVVQEDGLSKQKWVFVLEGHHLILDRYYMEVLTEGVYQIDSFYDRGDLDEGYGNWKWLKVEEVPFDTNLQAKVLSELVSRIIVTK